MRLAHPLYGEVLAAELPVLRSRTLRLRLAEAIQQRQPLTPDDALRASRWLLDAGEPVPAALLEDAAAAANLAGDADLGAQLAQLAIDAGAGLRATGLLAGAYILRDRYEEAEAVLAEAEPQVAGRLRGDRVLPPASRSAAVGSAPHTRDAGAARTGTGVVRRPRLAADVGSVADTDQDMVEGFVDCVEATAELLSDPALEPSRRRQMSATYALCLLSVGRAKEADELARRSRPDAPLRDGTDRYRLGSACCVGLDAGEDWPDLEAYATELLRDGIRHGDHEAAGFAAFTLGSLEIHRGRYRDAERWLAEAEAQFERHDVFDVTCWVHALQVEIAYFSGDPARVQTASMAFGHACPNVRRATCSAPTSRTPRVGERAL